MAREQLLLELGVTPDRAIKKVYERQYAKVVPKDGAPPFETWLLRQVFDDAGTLLVSHVSGPTAVFPSEADIELL